MDTEEPQAGLRSRNEELRALDCEILAAEAQRGNLSICWFLFCEMRRLGRTSFFVLCVRERK